MFCVQRSGGRAGNSNSNSKRDLGGQLYLAQVGDITTQLYLCIPIGLYGACEMEKSG